MFSMGYEASSNVPGLVPLRAYDLWPPSIENHHVPGTSNDGVKEVRVVPCWLKPDGRVVAVETSSDKGKKVAAYIEKYVTMQKLNARITVDQGQNLAQYGTYRIGAGV